MTNQELQELSKRVAEKFGINESELYQTDNEEYPDSWVRFYLHQDLERVMRLAIEHRLNISTCGENCTVTKMNKTQRYAEYFLNEHYIDHDTREQAVIVAVMKALCEVEV